MTNDSSESWSTQFAADIRSAGMLIFAFRNHRPALSPKAATARPMSSWMMTDVEKMRAEFEKRRRVIVDMINDIPGLKVREPEGAFYVFPKCSSFFGKSDGSRTICNSTDFALYLLEVGHVATVAGDAFGDPECFRISYATSDDNIREAMSRVKAALARLK